MGRLKKLVNRGVKNVKKSIRDPEWVRKTGLDKKIQKYGPGVRHKAERWGPLGANLALTGAGFAVGGPAGIMGGMAAGAATQAAMEYGIKKQRAKEAKAKAKRERWNPAGRSRPPVQGRPRTAAVR